ncbi:hypothetical protein SAMN05216293_3987 [Flagellimonas taeanensis]|jgi:hypothetical protein|uniref:Uncharacterized protein n=1 Tax=Flagellimonas taeanensis TaxID=1005926 RepID=A0A1M7CCU9_9FLAO|nr:hypothetical protein SAMN05216293_3987 [Allomuricauda taeanensis]
MTEQLKTMNINQFNTKKNEKITFCYCYFGPRFNSP